MIAGQRIGANPVAGIGDYYGTTRRATLQDADNMRIVSGDTSRKIYFWARSSADFTPLSGLTGFSVYRSRDGGARVAYTTPTIAEIDATDMTGLYCLTLDEDMTITTGVDSEEFAIYIKKTSMEPVVRTFELYRPKSTVGDTLLTSSGLISNTTAIASVSGNVGGNVNGSVGSVVGGVGGNVTGSVGSVAGNVVGSVGSVLAAIILPSIPTDWITSTGIAANAIGSSELDATAVTEIAAGVWATALPAAFGAGTAGYNLDGQVSTRALASDLATVAGYLDTEIAAILQDTGTDIPALIAASKAVVDLIYALLNDNRGEPTTGAPPASANMPTKLDWIFKHMRNKKSADGTWNLFYGDDGTTVHQKQATSELAGVVTIGEMEAGP